MKIRWTNNSIRLRITPSELEALRRNEIVREQLGFASRENGWSATILPGVATTSVQLVGGSLLIRLANADLSALNEPDCEGVYFSTESESESESESKLSSEYSGSEAVEPSSVLYYIEKDFPCIHPRASGAQESETETFPSPEGFEERKR